MVVLVALLQSAQDADAAQHVGFIHHHCLETTLQCLILLKIFLILIQRGGPDGAQFATCQGRLQYVGRIHGSLALSSAHKGVYLVDEEDYLSVRADHFIDDRLQPFLKLAFVLGTSHQCSHVEGVELLVLQILGHVAAQDAVGQPLHDGRLSRSRFAYQYGVVLRASAQNLQHTAYFLVASNDGVQLSRTGGFVQVDGILAERLVGVFTRLRGHPSALAQFADGGTQLLLRHSGILQHGAYGALHHQQCQHQFLQSHILVAHLLGEFHGTLEHLVSLAAQVGFASADLGQRVHLTLHQLGNLLCVHSQFLEEKVRHRVAHLHHGSHQVSRVDGLLSACTSQVHCLLHRLLRFDCKVVEIHTFFSFFKLTTLFHSFHHSILKHPPHILCSVAGAVPIEKATKG